MNFMELASAEITLINGEDLLLLPNDNDPLPGAIPM